MFFPVLVHRRVYYYRTFENLHYDGVLAVKNPIHAQVEAFFGSFTIATSLCSTKINYSI